MEEQHISFKTAKLVKKKDIYIEGLFIYPLKDFYEEYKKGELVCIFDEYIEDSFVAPAPTQYCLQKHLRDKHNIEICIDRIQDSGDDIDETNVPTVYTYKVSNWNEVFDCTENPDFQLFLPYHIHKEGFKSYEEALEEALYKGLKLIK